ncbi:hypothetical protein [Spiroplasma endosymbiont of Labia minor]|uniref:hypothetical protein n=1 Tax=Spiroplasma endosymbiont of Labia minor TaxID=3066305 RepID=UPI0030CC20B0
MSYYFQHNLQFTTHGMQRIKQRLNMNDLDDFEVKEKCVNYVEKSPYFFETKTDLYFELPIKKRMFFIVKKKDMTIITCTPISVEREYILTSGDNYGPKF